MYCSNSSKGEISVSYEFGFPSKSQVTHQTLLFVFSSCRWRQVKLHSTNVQSEILFWSEYKGCPSRLVYIGVILMYGLSLDHFLMKCWCFLDEKCHFLWKNDMQFVRSLYAVCMQFICSFETTYSFGKTTYTFVKTVCSFKTAYKLHTNCIQTAYSFCRFLDKIISFLMRTGSSLTLHVKILHGNVVQWTPQVSQQCHPSKPSQVLQLPRLS